MKNIKKLSGFLVLILVLHLGAVAQTLDDKLKEIDAYANTVMDTWHGPGMAIAIVKDDKTVFAKGYGLRELGKPEKVDENTIFEIASNSKAFTTASLAILVDEKKLSWNDKVSKYLPEFQMYDPWVTSELTVRDLVTHRVGLDTFSGDLLWFNTTYSMDDMLKRVKYLKPVSSFRTRYGYQNLMFVAAGKIVEKVSGKPWPVFVKERIMDQIGMTRSVTSINALPDNVARPHNESGGKLACAAADQRCKLRGSLRCCGRQCLGRGSFSLDTIATWSRNV
ncbi:MAG: beta-lactamase family protein [Chloracidobacterium sp.]|nr:beta-lactamase family protein [Chloracidobacterium sp.]